MGGTRDHDVKWNKPDWERQILYVLAHMWNLDLKINKQHKCKMGTVNRWEPMGYRRMKREGQRGWIWLKYFLCLYENNKANENSSKMGEGIKTIQRVNVIKVLYMNVWKWNFFTPLMYTIKKQRKKATTSN
jgi:hypothetical protein